MQTFTHKETWTADPENKAATENMNQIAIHNRSKNPDEYVTKIQSIPGLSHLNMSFMYSMFQLIGLHDISTNKESVLD